MFIYDKARKDHGYTMVFLFKFLKFGGDKFEKTFKVCLELQIAGHFTCCSYGGSYAAGYAQPISCKDYR
jgi:hypothetical protein